ncbi:MAG TPA: GNAT family N-acetyltransferase [Pirellulales bacterium]|nr:GNAT family N-acetyltransferase [Pirellulales bacterium]
MTDSNVNIERPAAAEIALGLDLAWRHIAPPQRAAQIERTISEWRAQWGSQIDPATILLVARVDGRVVGAASAQLLGGGTAMLAPPGVEAGAPPGTARCLLDGVLSEADRAGARMAQALLPVDHGPDFELLTSAGCEHLADLLYMVALARTFPEHVPESPLEFEPFAPGQEPRMLALLERTYQATRDCPRLNGLRNTADVLEGYRAAGRFDPGRWFFLRHDRTDVGCLLLTEHPEHRQWELVYVGLVPEVRGRGWGIEAVRRAQALAGGAGATCLLLAVDAANEPAIAMYAAAGFTAWDRRSVLFRFAGRGA